MHIMNIINDMLKMILINIIIDMVFIKITNYRNINSKKLIVIIITNIIYTIIGRIPVGYIPTLLSIIGIYLLKSITISKITNNKIQYSIIVTFISLTITYITYIISIVIFGIMSNILLLNIEFNNTRVLIIIGVIESVILYMFFRIKRFRNGISFLQDKKKVNNIGIIGFAFIGIAVVIFSLFNTSRNEQYNAYLFTGILIEAICLIIWIRRKITKHYKQNLKKNTIEELENKIKAKDEEIIKITEENKAIATINHKYSSRIKALEKISSKILTKPEIVEAMKVEFGAEFSELEVQIKKISEEYSMEMKEKVKNENKLDKTGIFGIDNLLEFMKDEAEKKDIKFNLKINANINYMMDKIIDQSRLETLLGDHIKDAIIAIEHSNNTYKSILTTIGIIDDCYEIRIYDTGIEFEIDTLLKIGTEAITTHKETGGSGIGFMTTFETLNETKASLIIEEKHPMNNTDYTKSVAIRFDGKNEYRIKSYRKEEIEKQKIDNRIILE